MHFPAPVEPPTLGSGAGKGIKLKSVRLVYGPVDPAMAIDIDTVLETVWGFGEEESVTSMVKLDVPAVVGVPLIAPELLSANPAGN